MSNRKRKHGIFTVSGDVVALSSNTEEARKDCIEIGTGTALKTIFKQIRMGGNRPRTIQSYEYIFKHFVDV